MSKILLTAALLVATCVLPAHAADSAVSRSDFETLQAQVQALSERLDALAASHETLQAENVRLKAELEPGGPATDARVAEPASTEATVDQAADVKAKPQQADWTQRVTLRGDFRYRHEHLTYERDVAGEAVDAADRDRQRVRARFGLDAAITDSLNVIAMLATGGEDPRSSNQTLGGSGTRKSIGLDLAYADWHVRPDLNLLLGKQPYPVWRPSHSYFLDTDYNPEGIALRWAPGAAFANVYGYWLTEQYNSDPADENSDANVIGVQGGLKFPWLGGETVLAANYYVCGACRDNAPLYSGSSNGNTTYLGPGGNVLRYDYEILDVNAQVGLQAASRPLALTAGYARNLGSGVVHDSAWSLGAMLGRASNPGAWEAGLLYQSVDKDALFGQLFESDFGDGRTDSEGWILKGGYALRENVTLNTTYYLYTVNKDVGTELDLTRLQFDLNYKF